jgi:pyruvate dehydrogenase E2 component (dihydrolipoamide acetyltransferase)/2-oxoglutarate dehydrogenase E2 component (dihydrolipoamide succinyltransferase)
MATPVVMPKLAMMMKQGKVVEWRAKEGERINKGQVIMVIETEKVTYDIEASVAGYFHIVTELDETVPVDQVVAWIAASEVELSSLQAEFPAPLAGDEKSGPAEKVPSASAQAAAQRPPEGRVKISPAAKKIAEDHGINWSVLTGTGPGGRIVKEDIEKAIETAKSQPATAPSTEWGGEVIDGKRVKQTLPLKGMRAAIAEHMIRSLHTAAQLTTTCDIDMSDLIRIRNSFLAKEEAIGVRISFTDLLVFILSRVLKEQPRMNSSLIDNRVIFWEDISIGVAVAVELSEMETGLIVPVIRNTDQKSLLTISKEVKALTKRARAMQLLPDDLGGGTFTITNFGVFGVGYSITTPVINQPEAAILGTGAVVDRAVVREGQIVVRPVMPLSLTFDHRLLDGAPIGKFFKRLQELLENPHLLLLGE